jgi:hypothetical protein
MKRIILMLTVAALMVVAMTVAAAPGFAWEVNGKHCNSATATGTKVAILVSPRRRIKEEMK